MILKSRLLSSICLAFLFQLQASSLLAQGDGELKDTMNQMQPYFMKFGSNFQNVAKYPELVNDIAAFQHLIIEAKERIPAYLVEKGAGSDEELIQAKILLGKDLLGASSDLEIALMKKDKEAVKSAMMQLDKVRTQGHGLFKGL